MFAFPVMHPAAFFNAVGLPLLGIIGITLVWVSGAVTRENTAPFWATLIAYFVLFAWLAVRCHRLVLVPRDEDSVSGTGAPSLIFRYLSALTTGAVLKYLGTLLLAMMAILSFSDIAVSGRPPVPSPPPEPDADLQRMIDYGVLLAQVPLAYLLARCSTLLPAIALGAEWAPGTAWRQTRGNGWRLVLVVFLLPWALDAAVDWVHEISGNRLLVALLAIARAVFLALGIIALSLSYRELPPWPAPPPTPPPS